MWCVVCVGGCKIDGKGKYGPWCVTSSSHPPWSTRCLGNKKPPGTLPSLSHPHCPPTPIIPYSRLPWSDSSHLVCLPSLSLYATQLAPVSMEKASATPPSPHTCVCTFFCCWTDCWLASHNSIYLPPTPSTTNTKEPNMPTLKAETTPPPSPPPQPPPGRTEWARRPQYCRKSCPPGPGGG